MYSIFIYLYFFYFIFYVIVFCGLLKKKTLELIHLKFTRHTHGTTNANAKQARTMHTSVRETEINFCAARDTPIFCLNSSLNTTSKLNGFKYFHLMLCLLAMIA